MELKQKFHATLNIVVYKQSSNDRPKGPGQKVSPFNSMTGCLRPKPSAGRREKGGEDYLNEEQS